MRSKSVPVNLLIRKIHTALGEGGEEGSPEEESDKVEGEEDEGSMTPTSTSPPPPEEEGMSPPPGDLASPTSPRSGQEDFTPIRESSSRCDSRESMESPITQRLPPTENERLLAERAFLQGVPLGAALSPVGVALPPNLPSATLLPPQSAAMAAYISAAAAAAVQSQRLMMTSPSGFSRVAPVSPLITSTSPSGLVSAPSDYSPRSEEVLDFSKRSKDDDSDSDAVNLSKSGTPPPEGAPLDLTVSGSRKRPSDEPLIDTPHRKPRTEYKPEFKPAAIPQWPPGLGASHLPYFAAAVAAAGLSPKTNPSDLWNGKIKPALPPAPNDATKALEKMSELSKLGGEDLFRTMATAGAVPSNSSSNRHSAWQSHWLNKGADQAKDVLKCVWCKQSFSSLTALTTHMKESKHCGVNVPVHPMQSNSLPPQPQITSPSHSNSSTSSSSHKPQNDLNMLIKETMPLPRKLVRGQDVWLGKGAEQTRQILKCMWCGQSFRSLAEMTTHMQQTQHYTNIISQEQIISWRSSDDKEGRGGGGGNSGGGGSSSGNGGAPPGAASSHVSAVLTCKVCDQAFTSLKDLSNHMVKNSHYKEHIMRSITECGGRRRQTREKRKKSLPVRKLLELERAQHDLKNGDSGLIEKIRDQPGAGRITCEKCGNKIETSMFVDHIRQCVGGMTTNQRNFLKSALMSNSILPPESPNRDKIKTPSDKSPSPSSQRSPSVSDLSTKEPNEGTNNGSSPSVLNAIEKLIEKSFDSRSRQNANFPGHPPSQPPLGSSILKRLGIDESVDYTKPLVDPQTMNLLRSYQQHHGHYNRRERSGSESSSISERGSSRVDSLTPERKISESQGIPLMPTPRSTPDIKREKSPFDKHTDIEASIEKVTIKKEIKDDDEVVREVRDNSSPSVKVKKEVVDENDDEEKRSFHSNGEIKQEEDKRRSYTASPQERATPNSPDRNSQGSPAGSDRSGTPRSTTSDRKPAGGSLGALSSMFDNLSGTNATNEGSTSGGGQKKGSSHPLAALQKLCDKTETHTNNRNHPATVTSASTPVPSSTPNSSSGNTPGAILAFSWACNDAVMTPDSIMKCAFCDTPFISKGAYRHHLSKMHFVKDGVIPDPIALKSTPTTSSASVGIPLKSTTSLPSSSVGSGSSSGARSPPGAGGFEESPHSKFLKYTELAKQLSSKYV